MLYDRASAPSLPIQFRMATRIELSVLSTFISLAPRNRNGIFCMTGAGGMVGMAGNSRVEELLAGSENRQNWNQTNKMTQPTIFLFNFEKPISPPSIIYSSSTIHVLLCFVSARTMYIILFMYYFFFFLLAANLLIMFMEGAGMASWQVVAGR